MASQQWAEDWKIGVGVWVQRHGDVVFRESGAELLAAIGQLRSITKAAKECGISYRQAWSIVQTVNASAGEPLVESVVGGAKGGGARLTPRGEFALDLFRQLRGTVRAAAAGILQRLVTAGDEAPCIHLAAAISLQDAMGQLLTDYALQNPTIKVRAVFGASNELAAHLLAGAPGDLFITGDSLHLDRLQAAGMVKPKQRMKLAVNSLALIVAPDSSLRIQRLSDLTSAKVKHLAMAELASPLGRTSRTLLEKLGLYEVLRPKLVDVDSGRAVVAAVQSRAVDVGLAFHSDAVTTGCRILFQVPASQAGVVYEAAVVRTGSQAEAAQSLLKFLATDRAARSFRRCGLKTVGKQRRPVSPRTK